MRKLIAVIILALFKELSELPDNSEATIFNIIELLKKIVSLWKHIEPTERKALMHECVRRIELLPDREIIVHFA